MRPPERKFAPFVLRLILLALSLVSTLSYAGSTNPQSPAGSGMLSCRPGRMWFGLVFVGQTTTIPATLTNMGSNPIIVSTVSPAGSGFTISGLSLPLTLSSGQSVPFSVNFSPQADGHVDGTFGFIDDASSVLLNLNVHGRGATPGLVTVNPPSINFGTVGSGKSIASSTTTQYVTIKSVGGPDIISQVIVTGGGFSISGLNLPLTLEWGRTVTFSVTFTPPASGVASGSITIRSNGSVPSLTIPLTGTGGTTAGSLSAAASSLSFGSVQVGHSQTLSETLTNSGGSTVSISQATTTGAYSVSGLNLPATLAAGQSTSFNVTFTPTLGGSASGNLSITSNASNPTLTVPLSGTGVTPGSLTATAGSLSFGNVQVGNNQTLSETLTNSGGSSITISQATATGAAYSMTGMSMPTTLMPGQSTSFNVKFTPTTAGSASGNLSITSNASNPTLGIPLSGSGVTAGSLTPAASSLSFGNVQVGNSQILSETLSNSGGSSVTITQAAATGAYSVSGLSLPARLAAGQSTSFNVTFTPTSGGSAVGNLSITSNASNPTLAVPLSGTGVTPGSLTATASSLSFGGVQVGHSQTLSETLTNSGGSSLSVTQANVTGTGFSVTGLSLPLTLVAGQSFTFGAVFTPTSAGSVSGKIAVVSNGSNPNLAISMSGSGALTGQLTVSPALLSFGSVVVGQSKSLTATLNATGSSVTISSVATGTSEFVLSGQSFPLSIAAGSSATITVTFTPQASGTASDSASFTSNAANTPVEALTGNGTAPPQHSVDLTWNPSPSAVNGYNIYRSGTSGGPYSQINSTIDSATSYIDNTVAAGNTYFYVTTAVDANGVESVNSNQVKTVIPTP
jgi:hypothetical protein